MKLVIIESPYKGEVARNKRYLQACIRDCLRRGESPYASHQMLTDALDDNNPEERALGIEAGLAWRQVFRVIMHPMGQESAESISHAFYVDFGHTYGMLLAKKRYDEEGIKYEERTLPREDPFFVGEIRYPDPIDIQTIRDLVVRGLKAVPVILDELARLRALVVENGARELDESEFLTAPNSNPGLDCECGGKLHRTPYPSGALMVCDRCGK
jgi:hypothetical protein